MRLLIVEDNQKMREMMKSIFKLNFTEIDECEDGAFALKAFKDHNTDWVFMDFEMNNVDGITASKNILDAYPDAKIIIVTNYDNAEFKKEAKSAGVFEYVLKENLLAIFDIINLEIQL